MENSWKRFLSLVLACAMVLSYVPAPAFADEVCAHPVVTFSSTATCTEAGVAITACDNCGEIFSAEEVGPSHNYVDGACSVCGEKDPVAPVSDDQPDGEGQTTCEHDYQAVETVAPTCTAEGYTTYTCSKCGDSYEGDKVDALGHSYKAGETVAPTCTAEGYTIYTCGTCGDSYDDDQVDALGHDYASVVTEPTCTEAGYTTKTCGTCGDVQTTDEVAALGHKYVDGKCACGAEDPDYVAVVNEGETPTEGYKLTIYNADGTVGMEIDGTKSASDFSLKSAIEDARTFVDNAFLFGITPPATFVVEMYEDSTEDESFEIGSDVTINGNGHKIVLAEGVELTNNGTINDATIEEPEDEISSELTLEEFVSAVIAGGGTYDGKISDSENVTVKIIPVSGDARDTTDPSIPNRLQSYSNPTVYYAQYQRFDELTNVDISYVNFVFVPAAVTVKDAWNTAGATTTADDINGELQLMNNGAVKLTNCTFDKVSVSPINATSVTVSGCEFDGLDAYAIKDIKASEVSVTGTKFNDCNGGFWFSDAPATLTVTGNTFNNVGRRGAIQFSANGDYTGTTMNVTGNTVTGGALLWQLNSTVTYEQVSAILDTANNTYETAYVSGSTEPTASAAKIGETSYESLSDALAAASAMTGDVTVEIYDKVTLNQSLTGSFDSIKFVGMNTDAEIYLDVQGYITATGKKVAFEALTLSKSAGGYITNAGFMNVAFGVYDVTEVSYTNCTFANGAYASSGKVTFTDCTFYRSYDKYGLWAYGDADIVVDDCTFADYRGIKMYAEGAAKVTDLTVEDTDFSAVTDKPAIVLTYGESVTLEGNTYSSTGTFELDLDGAPNGTSVTSDVAPTCKNDNGACGVLVDGKVYTTVAQAAEVATSGSTVTLLHDSTETVELAEGVVLNKNNHTAKGVTVKVPKVAQINDDIFATLEAAAGAAQSGEEIVLLADVAEDVTLPAGVIFNGNGKQVGTITAAGEVTFKGHTKAANFGTKYTNTTINIGEGACLEITGSGRLVIGHGCTFNITGTITNAKTADKATIQPSLIMPGASFTGAGVTFNVTDAYISAPSSYCSSSQSASGTFDFNFKNSIWESVGKLAFESQSVNATVNFELKDSVLNTGSHLVFGVSKGEVVIDNSNVNVDTSRQIENQSTMTIKNGSVVNGAVATSSNAINPGTLTVEDAIYAVSGQFSGAGVGTGTLIIKKGATVSVGSIVDKANIVIDATGMTADDEVSFTGNLSNFTGTIEVINNDSLEAKIVDGKIVLAVKPVAKIGDISYATLQDAFKAATSGCTIEILSNVTIDDKWDCRDYASNGSHSQFKEAVTINGNGHTIKFTGTISDSNWNTIFRFEESATVKDLTVDISEATGAQRVISAKKSLTVDDLTIIGSAKYGVIFGEGSSAEDLAAAEIAISNSTLTGTRRAISDNEGGKDVKSVDIIGNTLNANVYVSASESITFNNNTASGEVDLRSYAEETKLQVTATGNTLTANGKNKVSNAVSYDNIQSEFTIGAPVVVTNGETTAYYNTLAEAAKALKDGDTVTLLAGTFEEGTIKLPATLKNVTIQGAPEKATTIKNSILYSADGGSAVYEGITFDGIVFDNSSLVFTGHRNGDVVYKDWTVNNCEFKNVVKADGNSAIHFNLNGSEEAMENFTFTNNVINGVSGGTNSGLRLNAAKGKVVITGNDISNVAWNAIQLINVTADEVTIENNSLASDAGEGILNLHNVTASDLTITRNKFLVKAGQPGIAYIASADVSGNYWNGEAPAGLPEGVTFKSYYSDAEMTQLVKLLSGDGSENNPYLISNAEELFLFAEKVNAGNNYSGKFVKLTADINLATAARSTSNWTPIGTKANPFKGTFDGNGNTISNLNVSGESYLGLFGRLDAPGAIKNVKIENVNITGVSYLGAIVGMGYTGTIENCHVSGSINIAGNYMVGGISGQGYAVISNCSVVGNDKAVDKIIATHDGGSNEGDNVGGIVGHNGENNHITGCSVKNVTISGTRKVAGIVGITSMHSKVTGCSVVNVIVETSATADYANDNLKTMSIGGIVGQYQASGNGGAISGCTVDGLTFSNVNNVEVSAGTLTGGMRGSSVVLAPSAAIDVSGTTVSNVTGATNSYLFTAKIGEVGYTSLQAAIDAAQAGDTVKLLQNVEATVLPTADSTSNLANCVIYVAAGKQVILDLNGKTISAKGADEAKYDTLAIRNQGDLTITDSVGGGKVTLSYSGTQEVDYSQIHSTILNFGNLTIEDGTIENTATTGYARYAIDSYSWGGNANLTVKGGTVTNKNGVAIYANGYCDNGTNSCNVTVEDGVINGGLLYNGETTTGTKNITITGGTFNKTTNGALTIRNNPDTAVISGGTFNGEVSITEGLRCVTGGTFSDNSAEANLAEGYELDYANGKFAVIAKVVASVAGEDYATLEAAFEAAYATGDTIYLQDDVKLDKSINVTGTAVLDLKGFTISGTDTTEKNFGLFNNTGDLTIKDSKGNGKITLTATVNSGWNRYSAVISNNPGGKLTVNSGIIEHLGGTDMAYGIDSLTNGDTTSAVVIINGGTIKSAYRGIRQFLNGNGADNSLTINGGTVEGENRAIFFHAPSAKKPSTGTLTINEGADINGGVYLFVTEGSAEWPVKVSIAASALDEVGVIQANIPVGYGVVQQNGVYTVKSGVARIGDVYFATIDEALAAAQPGEEIILMRDAAMQNVYDVNGATLTITGAGNLTLNDKLQVHGESTLNISAPVTGEVWLGDGAILKDSTINGDVFVGGEVIFSGANTVNMLYDFGTLKSNYGAEANMEWSVEPGASLTMTAKARYGLGYGDNVTITGNLTSVDRKNATEANRSFFTHGIVAQESSGWNCDSSLTVKNAYVTIGDNNSFGNKPGNYGGNYTFTFEKAILDSSRITFYEANSQTSFNLTGSDVKTGTFMTRDADSIFTITNSKLLSTTTTNGTDEGNYHKGKLVLDNSELTYSAEWKLENGTVEMDLDSKITAPSITGTGKIVIDTTGYKAGSEVVLIAGDASAFQGTFEITNNDAGLLEHAITANGIVLRERKLEVDASGALVINNLDELILFRNQVNAGNTFSGKTIKLADNINLGDEEWTPISTFNGVFDGQGYTISNLVINGGSKNNQGFFGQTNNGEIKNVTFNNAKVTGCLNVGVVAGTPYTSKYTNVKVTGHVEVNGMSYVGGVGGKNAYANWTDITVDVDDSSYVKATSTENGVAYRTYVGGVIGFIGEGGHTFKNITSNINVIGDVCDIGGITGIAHYGNKFIDVTCSGDVTNTNSNADDVLETGGIAGVWHNQAGTSVTFENLTYTGTVSAPNAPGVVFPNGGLIGAAYSSTGTGELEGHEAAVNGKTYKTLAEAIAAANDDDTVVLLTDVAVGKTITVAKSITIDGNGNTITQAESFIGTIALFELDGGATVAFENVTFDGIKNVAVMRSVNADVTIDNCVIQNCAHTQIQGLVRLAMCNASITNTKFLNNTCTMAVTFGYDAAEAADTFVLDNCEFNGNTAKDTALVYYVDGAKATVTDNSFVNNTVNTTGNGATIYLGFTENNVVTGNLFNGNKVVSTGTSTRVAGAIFFGYESEISGNAFIGNTASNANGDTLGQVCTSTNYDCTIDLGGNYWGGNAPVAGKDYTVQHQTGDATLTVPSYYKNYNAETGELSDLVDMSYQAKVGTVSYQTLAEAMTAAKDGDTVTIFAGEFTQNLDVNKAITVVGETDAEGNNLVTFNGKLNVTADGAAVKNINFNNGSSSAGYINAKDVLIEGCTVVGGNGFRSCYTTGTVTFRDSTITGGTYGIHFDGSAGGNIVIDNCTITGWTSFAAAINKVAMTDTTFKEGNYNYIRFYQKEVVIDGCTFNEKMAIDLAVDGATLAVTDSTVENGSVEALFENADMVNSVITVEGERLMPVCAKIGDVEYRDLQKAIDEAQNGQTITMVYDVALTEGITVPADKTVTLDLAGKTISQTKAQTAGYQMILNDGNLTITDSSAEGTGTISYTDSGNGGEYISDTIYNRGTLVINGGTIENRSSETVASNGYPHAVDTYSGIRDTSVTVNGGTIYCAEYSAIRMFCVSATNKADLIINDGTVKGAIDMQNGTKVAALGTLTINGGTFETTKNANNIRFANWNGGAAEYGIAAEIKGGNFNGGITSQYVPEAANWNKKIISGGFFKQTSVTDYLAEGYTLQYSTSGLWGVVPDTVAIADGKIYGSVQAAIDAAADGAIVYLQKNVELKDTLTVPAGKTVTLDLQGHTITGEPTEAAAYAVINNKGNLTITGNGTIKCDHKLAGSTGYAVNTITNGGTLVIDGATIENKSTASNQIGYAIDNNSTSADAIVTIKSGKVTASGSNYYDGIRQFCNSEKNENSVTVAGGEISSIWMQNPSDGSADRNTKDVKGNVTITGGTVNALWLEPSTEFTASVSGGHVGKIAENESADGRDLTGFITGGTFTNEPAAELIAEGYEVKENENGTFGIALIPVLSGEGTEASPYLIKTVEDLILFRDSVNAGETKYNAEGVYVALTADINMTGTEWSVNIGDDCNATFDGIFDGQNHTISNLSSTETAAKADGYICTGLFGAIYGNAVVKNLIIDNATINTGNFIGNNAAAVVGFAYNCTGSVENVKVTNSTINANDVTGTGAIVGYAYGGALKVTGCSVENTDVTGAAYVGGIIGYAGGTVTVTNASVENAKINATSCAAGGIAGIMLNGGVVDGATVKGVELTSAHQNWQNAAATAVGCITGPVTVKNVTAENVTGSAGIVGSVHADKPTTPVAKVAARIGDVYYTTIQNAIAAAKDGETVTLLTDVTLAETLVIDKAITLDGGNYKLTSTAERAINVNVAGEVTVKDLTIATTAKTERAVNVIQKAAILTLDNVTAEGFKYTVNVAASSVGSNITINGGKFSGYAALNITGNDTKVEVNNAELTGVNDVDYHETNDFAAIAIGNTPEAPATGISVTVKGGKITATSTNGNKQAILQVSGASGATAVIDAELTLADNVVFNGYINQVTAAFRDDYADALNAQGYATIAYGEGMVQLTGVAKIGETSYTTLAAAFEAAQDGDTIKLVADTELSESIKNTKKVTLDLNGKTVTGTDKNTSGNFYLFNNVGELTVTGNGTMKLTAQTDRDWNASSVVIANNPGGNLTVENGTIKHLGGTDMAYGIDSLTNGTIGDVSVTINGGTISSTYRGIRQFLNSDSKQNVLTVNGGTIEGESKAIFFQDPSTKANLGTITVAKAAIVRGGVYLYVTPGSEKWPVEVSISNMAAGEPDTANVPAGFEVNKDDQGNWTVEEVAVEYVAWNVDTEKNYTTVEEALSEATSGQTVQLLKDAEAGDITVKAGITLDLNGNDLTATNVVGMNTSNVIDSLVNKTSGAGGVLKVNRNGLVLSVSNKQMPVWNGKDGYVFSTITINGEKVDKNTTTNKVSLTFVPWFETVDREYVKQNAASTGAKAIVRFTWTILNEDGSVNGTAKQDYVFSDAQLQKIANASGKQALKVTLSNYSSKKNLTMTAMVISDTNVEIGSTTHNVT